MNPQPSLATAAFLIADPARSVMLMQLLDGKARPAGELAFAAGVTAQTASSHLGKLLAGGLLAVETEGRHRYYRLAGPQVALALETLAAIGPAAPVRSKPLSREARELRFARCCYDHLAGHLGVAVTGALQARGYLVPAEGKRFAVPPAGIAWFAGLGLEVDRLKPGRHGLARQCLDWTEREHHLAGPLGVQLMSLFCAKGWLRRSGTTRAVQVTPPGWIALKRELGLDPV
ncbi:ArsR family transcriptional regulator [Methylobacterium sp. J-072]|uniref:ArsR/SmtB family transcription factor n=1 Tax=Methylobacterium sp. J-072 TaxID=2836651 RepID=UPI001FB900C1|nr:helix-turn-helix transcriptional regulator [Methylobacterium sp. J-072]MCJ2096715.1 ArsR family transcriptional regulator [Methylobacterium sp. J-072]